MCGGSSCVHHIVDRTKLVQGVQDYIGSLNWGYRVQLREASVKYINALGKFTGPNTVQCTDRRGQVGPTSPRVHVWCSAPTSPLPSSTYLSILVCDGRGGIMRVILCLPAASWSFCVSLAFWGHRSQSMGQWS